MLIGGTRRLVGLFRARSLRAVLEARYGKNAGLILVDVGRRFQYGDLQEAAGAVDAMGLECC
jgi:hypothetical protein